MSASQPLCLALNPVVLIDGIIPQQCLHWQPVASGSSSKGPSLGRTWGRGGWALAGVWRQLSGSGLCVLPTSPHKARPRTACRGQRAACIPRVLEEKLLT